MDARRLTLLITTVCMLTVAEIPQKAEAIGISELLDVISIGKNVVISLAKSWSLIDEHFHISEVPFPLESKWHHKIVNGMKLINEKIEKVSIHIENTGIQSVTAMIYNMPDKIRYDRKLDDLFEYFNQVNIAHRTMQSYLHNKNDLERFTLEDFAKSVISHSPNSVKNTIERIHSLVVVPKETENAGAMSLFKLYHKLLEQDKLMVCKLGRSAQRQLLNLFEAIALIELKGYTTVQFSYMLLKMYNIGNFTKESEIIMSRMQNRSAETLEQLMMYAPNSSREFWKCDPVTFHKDDYIEITELIQGYIMNEVDLSETSECFRTCADYKFTNSKSCYLNLYCSQQRRCNGDIINCEFIDSDSWVCPSKTPNRRYDYIMYENGKIMGKKRSCAATKVDSWWRYLFWHCSYCMCYCDEQSPKSDRFIDLRKVVSDIDNNMVVTGLRFVKRNRIVHLQVQQGKLIENGKIEHFSVKWVPISEFQITDPMIRDGKDYHTLTWKKRAINLDDLYAPMNHLVTGVQFQLIGAHLNLAIRTTPFDIETGELSPSKSEWFENLKTARSQIVTSDKDVPILSKQKSEPRSTPGQYLEFTHTSMSEDAAQTTVPFFDAQPVSSMVSPIDGVGIMYKTTGNYGGFIAPKLMTLDYYKYLDQLSEDKIVPLPE
ncbi:PREDICTED: uncharacterized protein LOC108568796 [Nicrophorus vespilloides]|uniref:Uncharacterized protein LOC108568796 n=1 Tax=Nicrophorus vespilloides TaxID=110193 RepID=A0ABM1NFH2_NICVS|nr:PREDICTED: uncharacterized protein LOC108568796 [Nicrophorus vespilloides]